VSASTTTVPTPSSRTFSPATFALTPPAWVDPGAVTGIDAAAFGSLDGRLRAVLANAAMVANSPLDADLLGLSGAALYDALGPLRKACLLNIFRKAAHLASADNSFQFIQSLVLSRQDRCFVKIDGSVLKFLRDSPRFAEAPGTLHTPLPNFHLRQSFKSKDAHANLQVTVMENPATGEFAADVDIDESAGIEHGLEVMQCRLRSTHESLSDPRIHAGGGTGRANAGPGLRLRFLTLHAGESSSPRASYSDRRFGDNEYKHALQHSRAVRYDLPRRSGGQEPAGDPAVLPGIPRHPAASFLAPVVPGRPGYPGGAIHPPSPAFLRIGYAEDQPLVRKG
jgi:hypothetical protein